MAQPAATPPATRPSAFGEQYVPEQPVVKPLGKLGRALYGAGTGAIIGMIGGPVGSLAGAGLGALGGLGIGKSLNDISMKRQQMRNLAAQSNNQILANANQANLDTAAERGAWTQNTVNLPKLDPRSSQSQTEFLLQQNLRPIQELAEERAGNYMGNQQLNRLYAQGLPQLQPSAPGGMAPGQQAPQGLETDMNPNVFSPQQGRGPAQQAAPVQKPVYQVNQTDQGKVYSTGATAEPGAPVMRNDLPYSREDLILDPSAYLKPEALNVAQKNMTEQAQTPSQIFQQTSQGMRNQAEIPRISAETQRALADTQHILSETKTEETLRDPKRREIEAHIVALSRDPRTSHQDKMDWVDALDQDGTIFDEESYNNLRLFTATGGKTKGKVRLSKPGVIQSKNGKFYDSKTFKEVPATSAYVEIQLGSGKGSAREVMMQKLGVGQ